MKIIFFGADRWFSGPVLAALAAAGHEVLLVVSKGEVAAKFKVQSSKFKVVDAKTAEDILRFTVHDSRFTKDNRPEAIVLASFGPPFLAAEILKWPKYGCLNVHASLLPRWRGASPVFAALAAGDKETGVSIMRMTEEIDRGPVLGQAGLEVRQPVQKSQLTSAKIGLNQITDKSDKSESGLSDLSIIRLGPPSAGQADRADAPASPIYDTRETLTKRLGKLGGELIVETLKKLETGQITEMPQPKKSPTPYTRKLTKKDGLINWSKSPAEIERFIRAVTPWPGAETNGRWTMDNGQWQEIKNIKILKAHLEVNQSAINNQQLTIDLVQLPGKNPVSWKQFLAGHPNITLVHGSKKPKSKR